MKRFINPDREQQLLFAEVNLNSFITPTTPAYIIDKLVNCLDTSTIEEKYNMDIWQGVNPLHPKTYIKISLLALHNCRFSLRKIEEDTKNNIMYRWITGDKTIDHSTIGKFFKKFKTEIIDLFTQIVEIARKEDLLDFNILAIDTVKIRANASYKQTKDLKGIDKEKNKIKAQLEDLIENPDRIGREEELTLSKKLLKLQKAENELKKRVEENKNDNKINITDFDCKIVQQANGEKNPGYCVTTAVDTKHDIITHFQVDNKSNDAESLIPVIKGSEEKTGDKHKIVVADSGFSSINNLEVLEENEQEALIPDRRYEVEVLGTSSKGKFDRSKFKYSDKHDHYRCPKRKILKKTYSYEKDGRLLNKYSNTEACKDCPDLKKCTISKYRTITRDSNEQIKEEMRDKLKKKRGQKKYKKRAHSAEAPFGDFKHNKKFRIFNRRGNEKVTMEIGLMIMLSNIMKMGKILNLRAI